jgi:hypothetical protein
LAGNAKRTPLPLVVIHPIYTDSQIVQICQIALYARHMPEMRFDAGLIPRKIKLSTGKGLIFLV